MPPHEFARRMREIYDRNNDPERRECEMDHTQADALLCEALSDLGYVEGVTIYTQITRWHS
jgi:hypothetical protein